MPRITLIAETNSLLSIVMGAADTFMTANFSGSPGDENPPWFETQIVSIDGKPLTGFGNVSVTPHTSIGAVDETDIILIPGFMPLFDPKASRSQELVEWLAYQYGKGTLMCSVCTGAFLLAETGLLDGKTATTNWQFADLFQQTYPDVNLDINQLIVEDSGMISAGAVTSYLNLCLYIIEKYGSGNVAASCSKAMLIDPNRHAQTPYLTYRSQKNHGDAPILKAQEWMETNYSKSVLIDDIAQQMGMSSRNFKRRFKSATGEVPILYLQRIRIEGAKRLLETTRKTVDEIAFMAGYENSNSLRKLFKKYTSLSPNSYREKFSRRKMVIAGVPA